MRAVWIELSGIEVWRLKEILDVLTSEEPIADDYRRERAKEIEKILFGAGP